MGRLQESSRLFQIRQGIPVPIVNGKCAVPDEITGYKCWKVYLVGGKAGYRITTNEVEVYQS